MEELLFFETSRRAFKQITNVYDFIWPTSVALWNLRWQVNGYTETNKCSTNELSNKFAHGSGIHGANLKRACIDITWEAQQQQFAMFLLINIFTLYETWLRSTLNAMSIHDIGTEKGMQFPVGDPKKQNIISSLKRITSTESKVLKQCFYNSLLTNKKNCLPVLNELAICYRFFKECRNVHIHENGLANPALISSHAEYLAIYQSLIGCIKVAPYTKAIQLNDVVSLGLRDVVGFSDILIRLIATIDAELSRSVNAEAEFIRSWKTVNHKIALKSDQQKRDQQVTRYVKKLKFPAPASSHDILIFLQKHRLVA